MKHQKHEGFFVQQKYNDVMHILSNVSFNVHIRKQAIPYESYMYSAEKDHDMCVMNVKFAFEYICNVIAHNQSELIDEVICQVSG